MAKATENPLAKLAVMKSSSDDESSERRQGTEKCGCVEELLEAQQSIRLQHWLTKSYSQHKALGKAYESLDELIDTFVETLVGARSRDVLSGISSLSVGGDPKSILDDLEDCLRNGIGKEVGDKETALLNIRDEMLGLVQRTKYLLTLE